MTTIFVIDRLTRKDITAEVEIRIKGGEYRIYQQGQDITYRIVFAADGELD